MSASTATSANDRQVGGTHYKTGGLEHWDLMHPSYLQGCASKYVARHTVKGGRQDLEKAIHYCEKYAERRAQEDAKKVSSWTYWQLSFGELLEWHSATNMAPMELQICYYILCKLDMLRAIELIQELISLRYPELPQPTVTVPDGDVTTIFRPLYGPGTPEDGGHHARQPVDEDAEEIQRWSDTEILEDRLPRSLSEHEWRHRCDGAAQDCYAYDVSAARYVIRPELVNLTRNGRQD